MLQGTVSMEGGMSLHQEDPSRERINLTFGFDAEILDMVRFVIAKLSVKFKYSLA